jgi:hypothetical protein
VFGIKAPPTDKQAWGSEGHECLAKYLRDGTRSRESPTWPTVEQAIDANLLPEPGGDLLVESRFSCVLNHAIILDGFVDCAVVERGNLWIIDHKFTSDVRWCKTEKQLRNDPQALIYAAWAMDAYNVPTAHMRWIYYVSTYPSDGGARTPVCVRGVEFSLSADDDQFFNQIAQLEVDCAHILDLRTTPELHIEDVPTNASACRAYGGCYYRSRCAVSPTDRINSYF